ncbi:helix-turn-helix domain-containing protein [Streptomyces sp. NPDC047046]|uniref:PucR family transcriptional regulator n=1 Tax=Streptomyces sp. NPDC047046 TaxID=3155378 RepID=UPI003400D944
MARAAERAWVRELRHDDPPAPASHPPLLAQAAERLGPGPVRWAVALGSRMAHEIIARIPDFGGGEDAVEILRMGTESAVIHGLLVVAADDPALARLTDEQLEGDRVFVRRGIRVDLVLRGVQIGHAVLTRELIAAASVLVPEEHRVEEIARVSDLVFRVVGVMASTMAVEHNAEHDRWVTSAAAERAATVRKLLAPGTPKPPEEASRVLGYPLERPHVALVLWQSPGREAAPLDLQRAASRLLHAYGCTATLEIPDGTSSLWAWGAWRSWDTEPGDGVAELPPHVHVAVSAAAEGVAGFRQSHLEAARVAELARACGHPRGLTGLIHYPDVELAVLLAQDLDRARTFVRRELREAAAGTPAAAELRETVAAYLRHDRSLMRAAEELNVARNTVAYRVKKFTELTGRDVADHRLELEAALRLTGVLGDRVTRG